MAQTKIHHNDLDLTVSADLDEFTSTTAGVAPASGGGTTNFLRADGTWAAPSGGGGGGGLTQEQILARVSMRV